MIDPVRMSEWDSWRRQQARERAMIRGDVRGFCAVPGCTNDRAFGRRLYCDEHGEASHHERDKLMGRQERRYQVTLAWRERNREKVREANRRASARRARARKAEPRHTCQHPGCTREKRAGRGARFCETCDALPPNLRRRMAKAGRGLARG